MNSVTKLKNGLEFKKCKPLKKGGRPAPEPLLKEYLKQTPNWKRLNGEISRTFNFKDFYETMGFVNALAFIANRENHHPDLEVGYKTCKARYSSHEVGGLTENDFICAVKIDKLFNDPSNRKS